MELFSPQHTDKILIDWKTLEVVKCLNLWFVKAARPKHDEWRKENFLKRNFFPISIVCENFYKFCHIFLTYRLLLFSNGLIFFIKISLLLVKSYNPFVYLMISIELYKVYWCNSFWVICGCFFSSFLLSLMISQDCRFPYRQTFLFGQCNGWKIFFKEIFESLKIYSWTKIKKFWLFPKKCSSSHPKALLFFSHLNIIIISWPKIDQENVNAIFKSTENSNISS